MSLLAPNAKRTALALGWLVGLPLAAIGCAVDANGEDAESDIAALGERADGALRMNHVQMKATHNSYHKARFFFPSDDLNYNHKPLDVQLESQGVRGFELDLHFDAGAKRFDVHHINFDAGSTCPRLNDCLRTLKKWSDSHRDHQPIIVQFETKDTFKARNAESYFATLESEIAKVWPTDRLITPDLVKGSSPNLRDAVTRRGWPTIDSVRGRAMFVLSASAEHRTFYTHDDSNLDGRLLFVSSDAHAPYASFLVLDDPKAQAKEIFNAVRAGFIVRTRADADLKEPKKNDRSRLEAALASGAQLVSTDFPAKDPNYRYIVEIPGGTPSRCNPAFDLPRCTSERIEH
jgi:hypothetical protein